MPPSASIACNEATCCSKKQTTVLLHISKRSFFLKIKIKGAQVQVLRAARRHAAVKKIIYSLTTHKQALIFFFKKTGAQVQVLRAARRHAAVSKQALPAQHQLAPALELQRFFFFFSSVLV